MSLMIWLSKNWIWSPKNIVPNILCTHLTSLSKALKLGIAKETLELLVWQGQTGVFVRIVKIF